MREEELDERRERREEREERGDMRNDRGERREEELEEERGEKRLKGPLQSRTILKIFETNLILIKIDVDV